MSKTFEERLHELEIKFNDLHIAVQTLADLVITVMADAETERGFRQLERNPDLIRQWVGRGEA